MSRRGQPAPAGLRSAGARARSRLLGRLCDSGERLPPRSSSRPGDCFPPRPLLTSSVPPSRFPLPCVHPLLTGESTHDRQTLPQPPPPPFRALPSPPLSLQAPPAPLFRVRGPPGCHWDPSTSRAFLRAAAAAAAAASVMWTLGQAGQLFSGIQVCFLRCDASAALRLLGSVCGQWAAAARSRTSFFFFSAYPRIRILLESRRESPEYCRSDCAKSDSRVMPTSLPARSA